MAQKKKYYAVANGRIPGIYNSWDECKKQTDGFSGAIFKSFSNKEEAIRFINPDYQNKIDLDDTNCAIAYVDGSYLHEIKKFSFGAVIFHNGNEFHFCEAFSDSELVSMRNVAGEIKGAEFAMNYCIEHKIPSLCIYYDYQGIEKWCDGSWKATKPGTIAYKNTYLECAKLINISFCKVVGHSGDKYNELADKLAKSALGINQF